MIQTIQIPYGGTYIKEGDTIGRILFTFAPEDVITLEGATINMQLFNGTQKVFDVSIGSGISVLTDKSFQIDRVEKEDNPFYAGNFIGDLEITFAGGERKTYFNIVYTIIKEYTRHELNP